MPHLELDAVFHQPNWTPLPDDEFRRRVAAFTSAPGWVVDGNYSAVQDIVWSRADTVVWLDLPRGRAMRRLIWRTVRRAAVRQRLWNGNRESFRNALSRDPEISVIRWAWHNHAITAERYTRAMVDPARTHLRFVRLTSPGAVRAWLAALAGNAGPGDVGVTRTSPDRGRPR